MTDKKWQDALYVGDTYRFLPNLTFDFGLRWEYFPMVSRDGLIKFDLYDPSTNHQLEGGVNGNPTHLGVTSSKLLFAPRLGIAYQPDSKTVIRTGFGIAYDTLPLERPLRGFIPMLSAKPGNLQVIAELPSSCPTHPSIRQATPQMEFPVSRMAFHSFSRPPTLSRDMLSRPTAW